MSASISSHDLFQSSTIVLPALPAEDARLLRAGELSQELQSWFDTEFTILDGQTGDVVYQAESQPCRDWAFRGELAREVARRHLPELLDDELPLLTLAVPCDGPDGATLVGVAPFIASWPLPPEQLERLAALLNADVDSVRSWAQSQTPATARQLLRVARLLVDRQQSAHRVEVLQAEVEKLSVHVGATYEEISLMHRLTQNLRISRQEHELGTMALSWLVEIMPFEGVVLQFLPRDGQESPTDTPHGLEFLTHGSCPLDSAAFLALVAALGDQTHGRPLVLNRSTTQQSDWPYPHVKQLILVPIGEKGHLFGWLAAFNHTDGGEFGTVEADLLGSVSAILGIHSGNAELYRQQAELLNGIVRAMTSAIDAKDPYTCGHSDRVARVAVRLAQDLGCTAETIETIYLSGLLHDVGKIGIDDNVLRKPGKLTPAEFEHIKTHAQIGYNILRDLKQLETVLPVVLHHHESWDGTGYPRGLKSTEIPELARIVAVADAFDAMGSDRPYRQGMPDDKLDAVIRAGAGRQWDPEVVDAFFRVRDDIRAIARRDKGDEGEELHQYL